MPGTLLRSLAVVALAASIGAADPLPSPPYGGGFTPPDKSARRGETAVFKAQGNWIQSAIRCYNRGVVNLVNGKPDGVAACIDKANLKFDTITNKLAAAGLLPGCLDPLPLRSIPNAQLEGFHASVYCAN